jgi:L-asparagine transporter-like permease
MDKQTIGLVLSGVGAISAISTLCSWSRSAMRWYRRGRKGVVSAKTITAPLASPLTAISATASLLLCGVGLQFIFGQQHPHLFVALVAVLILIVAVVWIVYVRQRRHVTDRTAIFTQTTLVPAKAPRELHDAVCSITGALAGLLMK